MRCYPDTTDWSCYPGYNADPGQATPPYSTLDPIIKARSEMLAWLSLQRRTGYQAGNCPETIRPCSIGCSSPGAWLAAPVSPVGGPSMTNTGWTPVLISGSWFNVCGCRSSLDCSCSSLSEVLLPGPVGSVTEILVDGVVVPASAYRIDDFNRLVRTDGASWPACQDMSKALTEEGTFGVTYVRGYPADDALNFAAGVLAAEYLKACAGDDSCRLPAGVTSIARQGVQMDIVSRDPFESVLTGIMEVDEIIAAYNPHGLRQPVVILSPDTYKRPRQATWGR